MTSIEIQNFSRRIGSTRFSHRNLDDSGGKFLSRRFRHINRVQVFQIFVPITSTYLRVSGTGGRRWGWDIQECSCTGNSRRGNRGMACTSRCRCAHDRPSFLLRTIPRSCSTVRPKRQYLSLELRIKDRTSLKQTCSGSLAALSLMYSFSSAGMLSGKLAGSL